MQPTKKPSICKRNRVRVSRRWAVLSWATVLAMVFTFVPQIIPGFDVPTASAHNLDTRMVSMFFDPETQAMLDERIDGFDTGYPGGFDLGVDPLIVISDTIGMIIKVVPTDGTDTGVGGYIDFYIPAGVTIQDAAYLMPDGAGGYDRVAMKGQALMPDVGAGGNPTVDLTGISRGPNILKVTSDIVRAGNINNGTLPGVYGDIGIFYSTDSETAYNSWQGDGGGTLTNNSGDIFSPFNKWDAMQMAAYGIKGTSRGDYPTSPIVDSNGRGNAPWGLASGVAGPESGYAWQFDKDVYDACDPTPTTSPLRACIDLATQQKVFWVMLWSSLALEATWEIGRASCRERV